MKSILGGIAALAIASTAHAAAPALAGHWVGTYGVGNDFNFLRPHFGADGKATVDMPAFEKKGVPLGAVAQQGSHVRFDLPGPDGVLQFDGKLQGELLSGKVSLNGKDGRFAFRRTLADDPARHQPLLGAYEFPGKRVVVLSEWGDFPQMFYSDMRSGRYASMFAESANVYYAGAGNLNPAVRETTMRFEGNKVEWQQAGKKETGRRLQFRSEEVTAPRRPVSAR